MNNSNDILKRLELLHPKKIDLSLNRLYVLLEKLNNPHLNLPPVIHIAGTNGKGSVTSFLRSIFENANLTVNVYTSPHLIRFNERIRLNSKLISTQFLKNLLIECEKANGGKQITFFEITTAAAFLAFSRRKSDILIIETGLGGRFDATNVIEKPICSVLTPISIDHTNLLGNSIDKITNEKLGILKDESIAVISKQTKKVNNQISDYSQKRKIKLYQEGKQWKVINNNLERKTFSLKYLDKIYNFRYPNLYGEHQIENAATAIATVLSQNIFELDTNCISDGLQKTRWPARMQNLQNGKLSKLLGNNFEIWLDGGHNIHASNAVFKVFENWNEKNIFLILGMVEGKDPINFISNLAKKIKSVTLLPIKDHQYIHPNQIKNKLYEKFNNLFKVNCSTDLIEALENIKKKYSGGKVIICGSLYLAGEVLKKDGFRIN